MTIGAPEPPADWQTQLQQLIAQGPVATPQDARQPIGVPPGYVVTRPGGTRPGTPTTRSTDEQVIPGGVQASGRADVYGPYVPVQLPPTVIPPTFYDGDEYLPAQMSAEDRARLQMKMYELGILDQDFQVGVWDGPTRLAYRSVLEFANASGITDAQAAMDEYGQTMDVSKAKRNRPPLVIRQTSPEDIRRVAQNVATQILGERADEGQVDRIVAAYQQAETTYQQQAYDATYESGTVTEPPTVETFAEDQLKERNPTEAGAYAVADQAVQQFMSLLAGPFGGAG